MDRGEEELRAFFERLLALRANTPSSVTLVIQISPPAPDPPIPSPLASPSPPPSAPRPTIQDTDFLAVRLLMLHPDWSNARIAREIGTPRTNLYRCPNYRVARAALEAARSEIPRGRKNRHGDIE